MATGRTRATFCGPAGEDIINIICEATRKNGIGSEIRRFQIITRHDESWDLSVGGGTVQFVEEWDETLLTIGFSTPEEIWDLTQYMPVQVVLQTMFPTITEPWEVTNQFFHIIGFQDDWDGPDLIVNPTSMFTDEWEFPPLMVGTQIGPEDWDSTLYCPISTVTEDWTLAVVYNANVKFTDEWEFPPFTDVVKKVEEWIPISYTANPSIPEEE